MDYTRIHDAIIDRARTRKLSGYVEKHHITPRSLGGTNHKGNLVVLTAEEHYVIHQLLVKMHPTSVALAQAANLMARTTKNRKAFGWLRKRLSTLSKGRPAHNKGKPMSEQGRLRISKAKAGVKIGSSAKRNSAIAATFANMDKTVLSLSGKSGGTAGKGRPKVRTEGHNQKIRESKIEYHRQKLIALSYGIAF